MIVLIVEDEFPTRQELRFVLEQLMPEVSIYEAGNGDEGLMMLERIRPDVVFLDINMPKRDGLSTAREIADLSDPPLIIFATAYDEHALKAFELSAIDYVVKPFSKKRLSRTVEKIRSRIGEKKLLEQQREMIQQFLDQSPERHPSPEQLWAEGATGNRERIPYAKIAYLEARDKMVFLHTLDGEERQVRYTLKALEERLEPHQFCRIHKGYLVNLETIAELIPWFSGGYQLRLNDAPQSTVPVSRRHVANLKSRMI